MPDTILKLPEAFRYPRLTLNVDSRDGMYRGNARHYLSVGLSAIDAIDRAFSRTVATEVMSVLDMPCGYGRVARTLRCRFEKARLTVADIDKQAVDFCTKTFGARGIYSKEAFDDLELKDQFDLIWVGSLITHLDEHSIAKFFSFVQRHLSDTGIAVVSSHGPFVAGAIRRSLLDDKPAYGLRAESLNQILSSYFTNGFGFAAYQANEGAHYGISICTERWLRQMLTDAAMVMIAYEHHGWDSHHDVISFAKR